MNSEPVKKTTHFGYQEVPVEEKSQRVRDVFRSVADNYDLMNDFMSFGMHRLWKQYLLRLAKAREGHIVLDVASGTGDLGKKLATLVGNSGHVYLTDINDAMLKVGRDRFIDENIVTNVSWIQANAEQLPFPSNTFDRITIAFGLRNVTHKSRALASMYQVLRPGGQALILEFSKVHPLLSQLYDFYSFNIIPTLGEFIAKDRESYQYLVESIRMHPDQKILATLMTDVGFEDVHYENFFGGVVAIHIGKKY